MSEILRIKISNVHTLIAYEKMESATQANRKSTGERSHELCFKVGPMSDGCFLDCTPEAASALLEMAKAAGSLPVVRGSVAAPAESPASRTAAADRQPAIRSRRIDGSKRRNYRTLEPASAAGDPLPPEEVKSFFGNLVFDD